MKEKSCAYGSSGGRRRAGWTLTAGGTRDKRWGSGGEGVDVDYPLVNVDDVRDGVRELERAARQGFAGAMITEYPPEDRRYDQPEYEILWAAQDLDMPLSLHTAARRQGKIRGVGPKTLRDASSRATKALGPATSMCDMIFSGVFERYLRLQLAIVEFELAWARTCSRAWTTPTASATRRPSTACRSGPRRRVNGWHSRPPSRSRRPDRLCTS
jgi:Amidohydrolase